ncbi:MAG TPA: hypothetical protein VHS53_01740, partial [Mucilaginibacter sp.]|nr:hypothetical protein [Mucilaginibacter sp.]
MKNSLLLFLLIFLAAVRVSAQCTFTVSLSSSSPNICSGSSVVLTATPSGGGTAPFSYAWSTGETTSSISVSRAGTYTVTVTDKTPGCTGVPKNITVGSGVAPVPPTVTSVPACPNSPVTLTATAPGGTYQWYDAATGGNFLATGASYTTPPITTATTYYVETTVNGCTSSRAAVAVTLISNPTAIGASICAGNTAILQASHADSYTWYDAASGGNVVGTGPSFVTPVLSASTTYYLQGTTNGCVSPLIPVPVSVTPAPAMPTATGAAICTGGSVTLHARGPGTIDWFSTPTGGTSLISSPDFTTPPLSATTTYYVQSTLNTCVSGRTPVTVTVNTAPTAPVIATPPPTCVGGVVTLTPTGPGGTYEWYNAQNGGTLLFTGPSFTTPPLNSSTVYYVQADN